MINDALRETTIPRRGSALLAAAALALALAPSLAAQDAQTAAGGSEEDMFGAEETVTQAAETPSAPENQGGFLKYDQVKVGGSITGTAGFNAAWASAWDGSASFLDPDARYVSPDLEGKVTIVAKPAEDFGVNMDFRTSWPFSTSSDFLTGATYTKDDLTTATTNESSLKTTSGSASIPNISVWALYSKFSWNDRVYFSFGKQPLSWGVSKGAFQPADDIFALSASIDLTDTTAEREGPVSLKTTVPLSATNNFYLYAGLPSDEDGSVKVDPADARLAAKVEYGFGNTELALGAFYAYNDHPRALVMGTTGIGSWNIYGEGVLKYGSERYFISEDSSSLIKVSGSQESGKLYFTGTLGGYYSDSDSGWTAIFSYLYNGEAQDGVTFAEAYTYYAAYSDNIDRMKYGTHYAFASITKAKLVKDAAGDSKLAASLIAITNLSDLSGYIMPSLTWTFFDYLKLKVGATFNFGEAGDEYIFYGVGAGYAKSKPGAALNLTLTLGSGSF